MPQFIISSDIQAEDYLRKVRFEIFVNREISHNLSFSVQFLTLIQHEL